MTTYITSYQRNVLQLDVSYADTMWIQAISFATTGIALPLGSYLQKLWGPRPTVIMAMLFMRYKTNYLAILTASSTSITQRSFALVAEFSSLL